MPLFTITRSGPGRLSTLAAPAGGTALDVEMLSLAADGVVVLVSALSAPEVDGLQLAEESAAAERAGIRFVWLPMADRSILPADELAAALASVGAALADGANVAVHCRFGIGRASTLAAALLVGEGSTPDDAWRRISAARGCPVPDTQGQVDWVASLYETRVRSA